MTWPNDGPPCSIGDIAQRMEKFVRMAPRPVAFVNLKDAHGVTVATVPVGQQTRPDGPWRENGR